VAETNPGGKCHELLAIILSPSSASRWNDSSHLYDNRDLAVTTDFRDVFAEILAKRMAIANLGPVFPGYELSDKRRQSIIST